MAGRRGGGIWRPRRLEASLEGRRWLWKRRRAVEMSRSVVERAGARPPALRLCLWKGGAADDVADDGGGRGWRPLAAPQRPPLHIYIYIHAWCARRGGRRP